jgi:hypothetical protein
VQDAERLEVAIEGHVRRRLDEAVTSLGAGDVLHALEILEPLAKRLARHPLGVEAKGELARTRTEPALRKELQAQRELEKAWKAAAGQGLAKAIANFERVVKRYPDTAAARRLTSAARPARIRPGQVAELDLQSSAKLERWRSKNPRSSR